MAVSYRNKIRAIALAEVGTKGGSYSGDDKYIKFYNSVVPGANFSVSTTPWCAIFSTWVYRQAGVPTSLAPNFASCSHFVNSWLRPKNYWVPWKSSYVPKVGQFIFFDWTGKRSEPQHVGLVTEVNTATRTIYTVEGNTKGGTTIASVRHKSYPFSSVYIMGYGDIPLDELNTTTTAVLSQTEVKKLAVQTVSGSGYRIKKIPIKNIKKIQIYINRGRKTLDKVMKETGANYGVNGTLYEIGKWIPCENVKADGKVYSSRNWSNPGFFWNSGSDIKYGSVPVDAGSALNYLFGNDLINAQGQPQLVNWSAELLGSRGRTLMGIDKDGNLVLYTCLDGSTGLRPEGARTKMIELNCTRGAINLDGGSSVGWYDADTGTYQRPGKGYVENYVLFFYEGSTSTTGSTGTTTSTTTSRSTGTTQKDMVMKFQTWLNANYRTGLVVDGSCGPNTKRAAVKAIQSYDNLLGKGLAVDGSFGPKSRAATPSVVRGTRYTPLVYVIQGLLYGKGYNPNGFDGSYGPGCITAVKAFQKANGLVVDGNVGTNTWAKLVS